MAYDIKRPGSEVWESESDLDGVIPLEDVVGTLFRYPTGDMPIVLQATAVTEPDEAGKRHVQLEVYTGE